MVYGLCDFLPLLASGLCCQLPVVFFAAGILISTLSSKPSKINGRCLVLCRYCLGAALALAEMKVFLALLARSYSFTADNNTEWKPALGFYPANGLPLVLTRM